MNKQQLDIEDAAKPVRPKKPERDPHYLRPKEAEKKMKMAAGINQTVWISGVCGSGKTGFVTDYMKRRRYSYYSAKEVIPEQVEIPNVSDDKANIIVIDDLYGIAEPDLKSSWLSIITELVLREDVWLVLVSRSAIPMWLHSLSIEHIFYRITEADLLLTRTQMEAYFMDWGLEPAYQSLDRIWQLGYGNPLWCRICAIELTQATRTPTVKTDADIVKEEQVIIANAQQSIWKYLNLHVYDQWDTEIRETLLKLSLLGTFDLDMAIYMTGNSNVNLLLMQCMELGNFLTIEEGSWTIREPMCLSMLQRLHQNYNTEYRNSLYIRAGDCFKIKKQMMRALAMYERAKDERSIAELLIQNARENPAAGHFYEMKRYYLTLSEDTIEQSVELMGAMSILQSMLMNVEESERWYSKLADFAGKQTGSLKKEANSKMLYLDIGLAHRGSADLISILKTAGNLIFNRKARLPEFSVTSNLPSQMNGGKDFSEWSKKDKELAKSIGKVITLVLGRYGKGLISLALAESGLEKGEDNYEVEMLAVKGRMEAEAGGKLEQCFVGAGIITWLSLFTNHPENAHETLDGFLEMAKKEGAAPQLLKNLNTLRCRAFLYQGRTAEIAEWMQEAPDECEEFYCMDRFRYLTKVRVYLADHKYKEAGILLKKLSYYADVIKRTYIAMEVKLLNAILFHQTDDDKWIPLLQEVITEAEEYHFVRLLSREGAALLPLLHKHRFLYQNKEFQQSVEEKTAYMAEIYPMYLGTSTENANLILTENARKVLRLQVMGKNNEQIAKELGISLGTVKYHNKQTYKKLGVQTRAQAINEARNRKLI